MTNILQINSYFDKGFQYVNEHTREIYLLFGITEIEKYINDKIKITANFKLYAEYFKIFKNIEVEIMLENEFTSAVITILDEKFKQPLKSKKISTKRKKYGNVSRNSKNIVKINYQKSLK